MSASIHDDGAVLFHAASGRLFASNKTGARIWEGLERHLSVDAIAADICREYRIAYTTAWAHTAQFVAELEQQGLIERNADRRAEN